MVDDIHILFLAIIIWFMFIWNLHATIHIHSRMIV